MLADLLRDTEPSLALLRRRSLVASADRSTLDAWSSRLTSLLSGPIAMRCAACALLSETVRQCAQPDFSRYREIWTAVLLKLLQPPAASSGGSSSGNSNLATHTAVRLAAAETLVVMVSTAARWPADRRELASHVSRLASTLVVMVDEPACQHGAVLALVRLLRRPTQPPHAPREAGRGPGHDGPRGADCGGARRGDAARRASQPLPAAGFGGLAPLRPETGGHIWSGARFILGSATNRPALRYELPAFELPLDARPAAGAPTAPMWRRRRRTALLRCAPLRPCAALLPRTGGRGHRQ